MDPLSQGITGSIAALSSTSKKNILNKFLAILVVGFLSGMAADLDIFIRSNSDTLLRLEFHRQFSHSLIFIPIGGLICAGIFRIFIKTLSFKENYIAATIGYGTHGLLDACTSYGTLLFWPFSNTRIAFNTISIIDPLYTLPLVILCLIAYFKKSKLTIYIASFWIITYLLIGYIQNIRATNKITEVAQKRGHTPSMLVAKPSFANNILWKTIYLHKGYFYVDAIHVLYKAKLIKGSKIKKLNLNEDFPHYAEDSKVIKDIQRFNWFSSGYTAIDPKNNDQIVDIRYSLIPNELEALWGIKIPKEQNSHVKLKTLRKLNAEKRKRFLNLLFNKKIEN